MLKVIINGCNGNMGQVLAKEIQQLEDMKIVAGVDISPNKYNNDFQVHKDIFEYKGESDMIIDFSHPYSLPGLLDYAVERRIGLVIATTGLSNIDLNDISNAAKKIPIFHSANMSLGINVLINLVKSTARMLYDSFDIEIIEKHHNQKIDSPSGTAYMIANEINTQFDNSKQYVFGRYTKKEKRQNNEIGIHAIRAGTIVGEHSVIFAGPDEVLEIKHSAMSKKIFALGAIKAAKFLLNKDNGLYNMKDLVMLD